MLKDFDDSLNILIVTVDPDISNVLSVLLNNLNYNVELNNSGSEALEQLKTGCCTAGYEYYSDIELCEKDFI